MRATPALEIRVPSDVQQIEGIVAQVVRRCREHRFNGRQLSLNVPVALTEALSNAMLRGNREDLAKHVRVRAEVVDGQLVLEVEDEGAGFDLEACTEDPTTEENLLRAFGGVLRHFRFDESTVQKHDGRAVTLLTDDERPLVFGKGGHVEYSQRRGREDVVKKRAEGAEDD